MKGKVSELLDAARSVKGDAFADYAGAMIQLTIALSSDALTSVSVRLATLYGIAGADLHEALRLTSEAMRP